jgi:hypothetical protein
MARRRSELKTRGRGEGRNITATTLRKRGRNITATMLRKRGRNITATMLREKGLKHHCDHVKEKRPKHHCDHVKEKRPNITATMLRKRGRNITATTLRKRGSKHHCDHVKQRWKTYFKHEKEWAEFWRIMHRIVLCYRCIHQDWVIRLDRISSSQYSSWDPPCPDQSIRGVPYSVSHVRRSKVI